MDSPGNISQSGDGILVAVTGKVIGDLNVISAAEPFRLETFPLTLPENPVDSGHVSLSVLLRGAARVVPFIGRTTELSRLSSWRDTQEHLSVILIFGPGGQGKTRLAAKFAENSTAEGWTVIQARHQSDPQPASPVVAEASTREARVLVVVDYAERWPRLDLERLLQHRLLHRARQVRVLLLARPAGYWWKALANPLLKLGAAVSDMRLGPLADTVAQRRIAFARARDRFADILGCTGTTHLRPPGSLADEAYGLALTLHMAALVAVDAHRRQASTPTEPSGLSAYLVQREYDHWQTLTDNGRITTSPPAMARLVALATLTQSLPHPDAVELLQQVGLAASPAAAQCMVDDHLLCYPAETGPDRVLTPLLPDRLGEDFLADHLPAQASSSNHGDPWLARIPGRLLTDSEPTPSYGAAVVSLLIETSSRWKHVRDEYLIPLLHERPQLALIAGGAPLVSLANYADLDLLKTLDAVLPERHVELDGGIAALTRRLTDYALAQTTDESKRADLSDELAARLSNAGLYTEAVAASTDAIAIRRQLVEDDPATHEPMLAYSLGNLGIDLWTVGRSDEALDAMNEAVTITRRRAADEPAAYAEDLAAALNNLAGVLIDLKRFADALAPAQEATAVLRRLRGNNLNLGHELGAALRNLAIVLGRLERHEEALAAAQETVDIYRVLASKHPQIHDVELAESLRSLGMRLSSMRQHEAALRAVQESVTVYRQLSTLNPAAHEQSLANALNSLGSCLWRVGQQEQAVAINEEAVQVGRRLVEHNPQANARVLGIALNNLANRLLELSRPDEAFATSEEALAIWQRLAAAAPGTFEKEHARATAIHRQAISETSN